MAPSGASSRTNSEECCRTSPSRPARRSLVGVASTATRWPRRVPVSIASARPVRADGDSQGLSPEGGDRTSTSSSARSSRSKSLCCRLQTRRDHRSTSRRNRRSSTSSRTRRAERSRARSSTGFRSSATTPRSSPRCRVLTARPGIAGSRSTERAARTIVFFIDGIDKTDLYFGTSLSTNSTGQGPRERLRAGGAGQGQRVRRRVSGGDWRRHQRRDQVREQPVARRPRAPTISRTTCRAPSGPRCS